MIHGERLAQWCLGGEVKPKPTAPANNSLKALANELWSLLKPIRGTTNDWVAANNWLWREEILDGAVPEAAPKLSEKRFAEVIAKCKERLSVRQPELVP